MKFLQNLLANSAELSKAFAALAGDVVVNMHNGWTSPTGIISDVFVLLVYLVPNVKPSGPAAP